MVLLSNFLSGNVEGSSSIDSGFSEQGNCQYPFYGIKCSQCVEPYMKHESKQNKLDSIFKEILIVFQANQMCINCLNDKLFYFKFGLSLIFQVSLIILSLR